MTFSVTKISQIGLKKHELYKRKKINKPDFIKLNSFALPRTRVQMEKPRTRGPRLQHICPEKDQCADSIKRTKTATPFF